MRGESARAPVSQGVTGQKKMNLLSNARGSIRIGLEDYSSSDEDRLVSCTRNLFAGILLLFKHKLSLLSPADSDEALVKEKVRPEFDSSGKVQWVGRGRKTVDFNQIQERFESLGIPVDWERVKKINGFRNDVEHYYTKLSKDAIRELICDSFIVIRDFLKDYGTFSTFSYFACKVENVL